MHRDVDYLDIRKLSGEFTNKNTVDDAKRANIWTANTNISIKKCVLSFENMILICFFRIRFDNCWDYVSNEVHQIHRKFSMPLLFTPKLYSFNSRNAIQVLMEMLLIYYFHFVSIGYCCSQYLQTFRLWAHWWTFIGITSSTSVSTRSNRSLFIPN